MFAATAADVTQVVVDGRVVVRQGDAEQVGRDLTRDRDDREAVAMTSTLITDIGELVTNDPARGGPLGTSRTPRW